MVAGLRTEAGFRTVRKSGSFSKAQENKSLSNDKKSQGSKNKVSSDERSTMNNIAKQVEQYDDKNTGTHSYYTSADEKIRNKCGAQSGAQGGSLGAKTKKKQYTGSHSESC